MTTDSRYAQYNRATDWAKNEAILLNIARASENQPLNFLVYNAYTGSATNCCGGQFTVIHHRS